MLFEGNRGGEDRESDHVPYEGCWRWCQLRLVGRKGTLYWVLLHVTGIQTNGSLKKHKKEEEEEKLLFRFHVQTLEVSKALTDKFFCSFMLFPGHASPSLECSSHLNNPG